jgi:hypothetical protein
MSYLISQGVKAEKLRAVGRGEANPVASNDSPEGRANNRRVEIIVQTSEQAAAGMTQPCGSMSFGAGAPKAEGGPAEFISAGGS